MSDERLDILLIAPNCDGTDVGEAFCAHRWVQHLSARRQRDAADAARARPHSRLRATAADARSSSGRSCNCRAASSASRPC